jgi:hypothetical protein
LIICTHEVTIDRNQYYETIDGKGSECVYLETNPTLLIIGNYEVMCTAVCHLSIVGDRNAMVDAVSLSYDPAKGMDDKTGK